MSEFCLIQQIQERARAHSRSDVILGIGDDAALLRVPEGCDLVVSTDTLIAGVHFPIDTAPEDIGWKALAVNLSDLAAMAATPAWVTLALTLPQADSVWLGRFLDGFFALAEQYDVALVGGDTTRGPLSITVTAHGFVPAGQALRRDTAQVGDDIWVTGTLGDAAAGLVQWQGQKVRSAKLRHRLDRPTPRVQAGLALRPFAHAAIDISDGLAADLRHILERSGVGAELELARLPTSCTLADHFKNQIERWQLQLAGGDDYELCFTAPIANALAIEHTMLACNTAATVIGRITAQLGLQLHTLAGEAFELEQEGFHHFT